MPNIVPRAGLILSRWRMKETKEGIIIGPKVSIDKIQSNIYWSEGNTAWEYRGNASVVLGQEIEHWIEFGSVQRFGQR